MFQNVTKPTALRDLLRAARMSRPVAASARTCPTFAPDKSKRKNNYTYEIVKYHKLFKKSLNMLTCLKPLTVGENDLKIFAERSFTIPNPPNPSDPPIVVFSSSPHPIRCFVLCRSCWASSFMMARKSSTVSSASASALSSFSGSSATETR